MVSPIESVVAALAIVAALWGVGRPLARWLAPDIGPLARGLWSVALGMIVWQSLLALFLATHCWELAPISTLTLLCATWGSIESTAWLAPRLSWPARSAKSAAPSAVSPRSKIVAALAELFARPPLLAPAIIAASIALAISLAPPTRAILPTAALAEAHRVAASGSAQSLAHGLLTPGVGATLLFAWAESVADPGAVCLLNWLMGLFFACAVAMLAAPVLGSRHAMTAGAIALVTPGVVGRLMFPSAELAPAGLLLLAAAAWWRASVDFGGARWYRIAIICASGALGPAWVFATVLVVVWVQAQAPTGRAKTTHRPNAVDAIISSGALAGVPGVAILTGCVVAAVVSGSAWQLLHECFGRGALGCGPFLLAAAPGLWWTRRLRGMRRLTIGVGSLAAATAVFSPPTAALVLAALLAVAAAWVWVELERFPGAPRSLARVALVVLSMTTAWTTLADDGLAWPPRLSIAGREQYLSERLGCYRAAQVANEIVRDADNLLTNDPQAYWIRCQVTDERVASGSLPTLDDGGARPFSAWLREHQITHLLLVDPPPGSASPGTASPRDTSPASTSPAASRLTQLVDRELEADANGELLPLVEYVQATGDGERRYRLIAVRREPKLKASEAPESGDRHEQVASRSAINDASQQPARRR